MPPKTLSDIIESVKNGEKPDYDDLRYGLLVLSHLHAFDGNDLLHLLEPKSPEQLKHLAEESFNRSKRVMALVPKDYLGRNWNPDEPAYQEERKLMKRLLDKIISDQS